MSADDNTITTALGKISNQLGQLQESQERQQSELAEIKFQVKATNGRVTALEATQIAQKAVEEERNKFNQFLEHEIDDQEQHKSKLVDRGIGSVVTLLAVIVGAVLADLKFF